MVINEVFTLSIPEIKVIRFKRFGDHRGYFTEHCRLDDFHKNEQTPFLKDFQIAQCNESFALAGTIKGWHFQWNPFQGKLVRPLHGRLVDYVLDIRQGSPTYGKITAYDLKINREQDFAEWIWIPPGFAHAALFPEDTTIEYFCTGIWNPNCEASISPLAQDLDWSLCPPELKKIYDEIVPNTDLITDKDRDGYNLETWKNSEHAQNFTI